MIARLGPLLLAFAPQARVESILADAFAKYRAGEYAAARDLYRAALAEGAEGGEIRYNVGNCEARAGNWAAALAEYRRAERYLPRDGDLRHNLGVARRRLGFETPPPGLATALRDFFVGFTRGELLAGALAAEALFFGLLALRALRPSRLARAGAVASGLVLLLSLAALGHEAFVRSARRSAVVLSETGARSEPRLDREEIFRLRPGEEVRLLRTEGEWLRIDAAGRGVGWAAAASLAAI